MFKRVTMPVIHLEIKMKFLNIGKSIGALVVAAFLVIAAGLTMPAKAFDAAQKAEIEALIHSYIINNPEIILEAQDALEKKRALATKLKVKQTLEKQHDLIFASKNQYEIGNPDADVTVVEFFDYNCAFCKRAMSDMNKLLKKDKNLKFVLKELPILSEASVAAHRVSAAVGTLSPKSYGEFHRRLLGASGQKNGKRALQLAEKMGLDIKKILELSKKEEINDGFREVNTLATNLGMNGTPSYVIGDEVIFGALGYDVLKAKIDKARKCNSSATC